MKSVSIAQNIVWFREKLQGSSCRLVAVSKTKPPEMIMEAYEAGHRLFGENKAQELVSKFEALPKDIEWHMIGHLQRNKVKYIASFVHLIQSIDSLRLLEEVEKQAARHGRSISCLLQLYIAEEETKFGLSLEEATALLQSAEFRQMTYVQVAGVMGVATNTDNMKQLQKEFRYLRHCFEQLKFTFFANQPTFRELSMGMSSDYALALAEGSTLIRVGSAIFGTRDYSQAQTF